MCFCFDPCQLIPLVDIYIYNEFILQACLGPKAKANEKNLVQVTTTDSSDSSVTFTILSLTSGKTDQVKYIYLQSLQILLTND